MDTRLIGLELVLHELGIEPNIDRLEDRVRLQKAIYLSQEAGVPLGYRFSWYVKGPYSPSLTRDYYYLDVASGDDSQATHGRLLRDDVQSILKRIGPIMSVPKEVQLKPSAWVELVSSIHFLLKTIGKHDPQIARMKLRQLKPDLYPHFDIAERQLAEIDLLPGGVPSQQAQ